jgi:hypothetical protein
VKKLVLMACSALLLAVPSVVEAQVQFGPQIAWGDDADFGIGARVALGLPQVREGVQLHIAGDYFFIDCPSELDCSWIELNSNLHLPVPLAPNMATYAGAGLNVARVKVSVPGFSASDTEVGLNILGGIRFPAAALTPFVEASFTLGGSEQFGVRAGILFGGR